MNKNLSLREIEVMKLIKRGLKYREVAEELFISINAVGQYVERVKNKLTAYSKDHAIERFSEVYSEDLEKELLDKEFKNEFKEN